MALLQNFYETTLEALKEAKNDRLWFKTNTKLGKLYFDREDYGKLQRILKQLHQSCQVLGFDVVFVTTGIPSDNPYSLPGSSVSLLLGSLCSSITSLLGPMHTKRKRERKLKRSKNNQRRLKNKWQTSKKTFSFSFTFTRCERAFRAGKIFAH